MPTKKVAKRKCVNMELWSTDSVTGDRDGGSKFKIVLTGQSVNSKQDFKITMLVDYYSLNAIRDKVKDIIQKRIDFQTNALKNISE